MKTCTIGDCQRKHQARGMCSSHYATWHREKYGRKDATYRRTCLGCEQDWDCTSPDGNYCSFLCRSYHKYGPRFCRLPASRQAKPKVQKFAPCQRNCSWCGQEFTARRQTHALCSAECKIKAKRVRRRGRASGSSSHYTWAEVIRLFLAFERRCAYCETVIEGQPDPDHVVPLSRGGSNSITNILPCCRQCNSDKRDLLLTEWNADRARRGLEPRTTSWSADDPRTRHLTAISAAA